MTKKRYPCLPFLSLALVASLASIGCAPAETVEETPATDGCEHAAEGPFEDVTAALDASDPPDVSAEHTAFRIATVELPDDGGRGGFVRYASAAEGDAFLFWSDHLDVAVSDVNGDEVPLEDMVHEVPECDELAMYHLVELGVGSYDLELGPTTHEEVTLVVVPGGAHAHDEEHPEGEE